MPKKKSYMDNKNIMAEGFFSKLLSVFKLSPDKVKKVKKDKKVKKILGIESYQPEGKVLSEGWHSPEHVNVDKNERKRWFNPKDIAPEFPEKAPPEQVDGWHPDLKKKDSLKEYSKPKL